MFFLLAVLLAEAPLKAQAPPAPTVPAAPVPPAKPAKVRPPRLGRPPLYRDTMTYPPFQLAWNVSSEINQVTGVFPHPLMPQRACVATASGVLLTDDAGRTWTALPEAAVDKVGPITDIAFHPVAPDTFYLASRTKGIWVTTDKGKTFSQIGSKATGLAADTVVSLMVYPGDPSHQTLVAVHGDGVPGLSRSRDNGKTWDVVDADYCLRRVLGSDGERQPFYLIGATLKEPDIESVYSCGTVGEYPVEVVRDVVPTDMVFAPFPFNKSGTVYLTTSDNGLYRIDRSGMADNVKQLTCADTSNWASIGVTWGPNADVVDLFLYDPTKLGLVVSNDDLATYQTASAGLPVGALVKEGAVIRPNANGTVFYNAANGELAIGRQSESVPAVSLTPMAVDIDPQDEQNLRNLAQVFGKFANFKGPVLDGAKAMEISPSALADFYHQHQLQVTARLPMQPAPPSKVTVDLSRFGGTPDMPLYDDGKHNDGAAGDGVYSNTFSFLPGRHRPNNDDNEWRSTWPGRVALGVTATWLDGHHQGAVGVVAVYTSSLDISVWNKREHKVVTTVEGDATVQPFVNPPEVHKGIPGLQVAVKKGAWTLHIKMPYNIRDITSYEGVSFSVQLVDGATPKALSVQLRDEPEFSPPTFSEKIEALQGKVLTNDYQQFVVPMDQLLPPGSPLQTNHLAEVIISGESDAPATLNIDGLEFIARYNEAASAQPESQ